MKIAYLIDKDALGGGNEYIRRQIAAHPADTCRVFYADRGECTGAALDGWGAEEIVVNHLKALLQLLRNPFRRPRGRITFVVHGIHLRKYDWRVRECGARGVRALPQICVLRVKRGLRRALERWLYFRCDQIVALTETDQRDIRRLYGRKLKVRIEPNTLDGWTPEWAEDLPPGVKGPFDAICIGRFDYQKGQDRLIRAMAGVEGARGARALAGARVLFIGDGPTWSDCQRLAQELDVADRCVFVGAIPNAERYLKCAAMVVSPSRWEGMPYLMMKARACGCNILATDCPGNRDVLMGYEKWKVWEL